MINVSELRAKYKAYSPTLTVDDIENFIKFIEKDQADKKKTSVTPYELREGTRRLKELEERQAENKRVTPENDFQEIE